MESFPQSVEEYRKQLDRGVIQAAYRGLIEYIMILRTHFASKYPDCYVSGSIYHGLMDMTYFSFIPRSLEERKLKIAIVFLHETCQFQAWLAGYNKQVQTKYWRLLKASNWTKYHLVPTTKGADSILESVLVEKPDFGNLDALTRQIEFGTLKFVKDIQGFVSKHQD